MPTPQQLRDRLLKKLKELFQLDQPDLDFGFFKIMHAKSMQVQEFIEKDLLKIVAEAFGQADTIRIENLRQQYEKEIDTAKEYGSADPENSSKVREAKARWEEAKNTGTGEGDIYDHLYRFFERYYDAGDFLSRRYYARETPGKAAPYAIPYNGEEVKLHWANADQYYIKTAEYFSNFTFDLTQAAEIREMSQEQRVLHGIPNHPVRVHFRIAEASEGEHGNVKAAEANKRYFIIHEDPPVALTPEGELVVYFEYRPDPEKTGQEKTWREKRNGEAVETILKALKDPQITQISQKGEGGGPGEEALDQTASMEDYLRLLEIPAPTEKEKDRPLLAKYVNKYTARNTMDYFIHKDLGGFLRRELDFYIKNEVMRIDDIETADFPAVEIWLAKIRVLRKIAGKLIDFLAQLEDFQKKLWLKKKFVVETNYCITLDGIPDALYPEIAAHEAQHDEWVRLFAIDEIQANTLGNPGYAKPLTVEFLKANDKLVLDTAFFNETFKARLLDSIDDLDEQCNGLLVHSENFQALNLLCARYRDQVNCVYIDPPYNTGSDGFVYKDSYQDSSWLSMVNDRIANSVPLIGKTGAFFVSIDEKEHHNLRNLSDKLFGIENLLAEFNWLSEGNFDNQAKIKMAHEYILGYAKNEVSFRHPPVIDPSTEEKSKLFKDEIRNTIVKNGPKNPASEIEIPSGFPASFENGVIKAEDTIWPIYNKDVVVENYCVKESIIAKSGWSSKSLYEAFIQNGMRPVPDSKEQMTIFVMSNTGAIESVKKRTEKQSYVTSVIKGVGTIQSTSSTLKNMGCPYPNYPKPTKLISYLVSMTGDESGIVVDFFSGSGPTGHATINLNREDNGHRKYILVEMADYFDTVLRPRIAKVVYSEKWKDGKPVARNTGISHCFKYIRLESYEDTLNNLRFDDNPIRDRAITADPSLKEDFMLHYLLDVETRGSQSLLNIDGFSDPTAYTLKVKKPGSDEYVVRPVDLVETFNYLVGLRVVHTAEPQAVTAQFKRVEDPEAPEDQKTRLVVDGKVRQVRNGQRSSEEPVWWFRKVEGWVPSDPSKPDNGKRDKVLIVWRNLTGDMEKDNAVLDEWFQKNRITPRDLEFDLIYVNGSNNLPNLRLDTENWKVRLIEEEFMKRMWDVEGV